MCWVDHESNHHVAWRCPRCLRKYLIPWEESLHGQMMNSATYIINAYRLRFLYLCVYVIGTIKWGTVWMIWCMFLMFPSYSKCITNVNKSIVICCFGNTQKNLIPWEESLHGQTMNSATYLIRIGFGSYIYAFMPLLLSYGDHLNEFDVCSLCSSIF